METAKIRKGFRCHDCKKWVAFPKNPGGTGAAGYATVAGDKAEGQEKCKVCYPCAAERSREWMRKQGTVFAYIAVNVELGMTRHLLTTWPGITLADPVHMGRPWIDNFGGRRVPVRFVCEGQVWAGTGFQGPVSDYVRARRTKLKSARW
jgi:hypothetical protein